MMEKWKKEGVGTNRRENEILKYTAGGRFEGHIHYPDLLLSEISLNKNIIFFGQYTKK